MSKQFEKWKAEHFFAKGATDVEPLLSIGDLMSVWSAALASSYNVEMPPMNVTDDEVEQAEKFASHVTDFRSALVVERAECDCRTGQLREAYAQIAALRAQVERLEQIVCDFQAASMLEVGNQGGPCMVDPIHVERHINELRAALATAEESGIRKALEAVKGRRINAPALPASNGDRAYAKAFQHAEQVISALLPSAESASKEPK